MRVICVVDWRPPLVASHNYARRAMGLDLRPPVTSVRRRATISSASLSIGSADATWSHWIAPLTMPVTLSAPITTDPDTSPRSFTGGTPFGRGVSRRVVGLYENLGAGGRTTPDAGRMLLAKA